MKIPAPPVEGTTWLHSELSDWESLRGHISMVVFWALGDEVSLARLSQVQHLTEKFPDLVAIGVHTPRLAYEDQLTNLESVVQQHGFKIPIVHDPDYSTWNRYNPEGWPTTYLLDDQLTIVGTQAGVDYFDTLEEAVWLSRRIANKRRSGAPPPPKPLSTDNRQPALTTPLSYPSSIRATGDNEIAFINGNRIIFVELDETRSSGQVVDTVDNLNQPGSIAVSNKPGFQNQIFVSEPTTGSILRCDRTTGKRVLIAGGLNRPTGLTIDRDDSLVVAESASQQILRLDNPMGNGISSFGSIASGDNNDSENRVDQPTALVRTEVGLVFCDAAKSSLCLLTDRGKVTTIVGESYEWGLVDGPAHQAKLQRPTDLAVMSDGSLLIADTGNNRIRRLSKRRVKTVGPAGLSRPESICVLPSGHICITDTGNSRIVILDPNTQNPRELLFSGLDVPRFTERIVPESAPNNNSGQLYAGASGDRIKISYPSPGAGPWKVAIQADPPHLLAKPIFETRTSSVGKVVAELGEPGDGSLVIRSSLVRDSTVNEQVRCPLTVRGTQGTVQPNGDHLPTSAPQ